MGYSHRPVSLLEPFVDPVNLNSCAANVIFKAHTSAGLRARGRLKVYGVKGYGHRYRTWNGKVV